MALANYTDLKAAVANWMARSDVSGDAADFVTLAEARLNRELPAVETDATITGTINDRRIDITAQSCVEAKALFLAKTGYDERPLTKQEDGTFPYLTTSGEPDQWAIDGTNIDFDRPLDQAYPFRFRFRQRFALSDGSPTNWLLTNHPDIYLAAVLVWGGVFIQNFAYASPFAQALEAGIPSVRSIIKKSQRGTLRVDPALTSRGRYDYATDVSS
jgi:hypothetical protein